MVKYMFKLIIDKVFFVIKRFIFSVLVIYAYDMIVFPTFRIIPMNFFTIVIIMLLGFPGVIGLSLFAILIL